MRHIITLVFASLATAACGGEPFSAVEFSAIGGEFAEAGASGSDSAGAPAAGRAGAAQGGSPGAGGSSAGSGSSGKPAVGGAATAGSASGGAAAVGSSAGTAAGGGAGVSSNGGSPSAGASGGGAGGSSSGGAPIACDLGITSKSTWKATAAVWTEQCADVDSVYCAPPRHSVDSDSETRFSTGTARTGKEWLQIDFGAAVSLSELALTTDPSLGDYTISYELRMSNEPSMTQATVVKSGSGKAGETLIKFPVQTGRYLRVTQTTAQAGWWSVNELDVDCW